MRVLIADDSKLLVDRLVEALTQVNGIEIVGRAETGAEASKAIRRLKPDVVILDICMPDGTGIDVLDEMQNDQLMPLVIVLTNYSHSFYSKRCLQKGAKFFFDKSNEFEKVGEVLRSLAPGGTAVAGVHS